MPVFLGYDFNLPKLKLGLILSNEITPRTLLPLSNEETEVCDQKEKFFLLFWEKNWMQNWQKKTQQTTDPKVPFLSVVSRTVAGGGDWFHN